MTSPAAESRIVINKHCIGLQAMQGDNHESKSIR